MRQVCRASAGSKGLAGATARASTARASRRGSRKASARAVGRMPRGPGSSSGSSKISRSLARCTLTAGWEKCSRSAARVTLCSASSTSRVTSRLRSSCLRLFIRIPGILGIHFKYTARNSILRPSRTGGFPHEYPARLCPPRTPLAQRRPQGLYRAAPGGRRPPGSGQRPLRHGLEGHAGRG
ncbi:hypothetical protein D3C78_1331460 [compost metagenome]